MSYAPDFAEINDEHVKLLPTLSFAEVTDQHVELLPARTVMQKLAGLNGYHPAQDDEGEIVGINMATPSTRTS